MEYLHIPVMMAEAIENLEIKPGEYYLDCTLGGGSYTQSILEKGGKVLAIDADPLAIENAKNKIKIHTDNLILVNDNFRNLKSIIQSSGLEKKQFAGVVFDLGISSAQLADSSRGFSFQHDSYLDMSFSGGAETIRIVNSLPERELENIFREYGEEPRSRSLAKAIVINRRRRRITSTKELVEIIETVIPKRGKIHPATKAFQALRIATNQELASLEEVLPEALSVLKPAGKLVVVSFHSLEDRIVKNFFRNQAKECICPQENIICTCNHKSALKIITKKPLEPALTEIKNNPRSRSAKLRVAEKIN
jgi:16S rRNA (cytosine1402-N4)-methyltransferase